RRVAASSASDRPMAPCRTRRYAARMPGPPTPRMRFLRPFTTAVVNPVTRRFIHHLPGFGIIGYRGRTSGRRYRTPMNYFRDGDDYVFALSYGADVDWVKNVLAAGEANLQIGNRNAALTDPELLIDHARRLMPFGVRQFLRLV